MASKTTSIYGHKVRTTSNRHYVVVVGRAETVTTPDGTFVAYARVEARSDNWTTIRNRASKMSGGIGGFVVIWDTANGEHFDWAGRPVDTYVPVEATPADSLALAVQTRRDVPGMTREKVISVKTRRHGIIVGWFWPGKVAWVQWDGSKTRERVGVDNLERRSA